MVGGGVTIEVSRTTFVAMVEVTEGLCLGGFERMSGYHMC